MKRLLITLAIISTPALAQTTYYRDVHGHVVGSAKTAGDATYYRDITITVVGTEKRIGDTSHYGDIRNKTIGTGTTQYQQGSDGSQQYAPTNPYYQPNGR